MRTTRNLVCRAANWLPILLFVQSVQGQNYMSSKEYSAPTLQEYNSQQQPRKRPQDGQDSQYRRNYYKQQQEQGINNNYELNRNQDRETQLREHEVVSNREQHKCHIWVPTESVSKYLHASVKQADQANQLSQIETCCTGYSATRLRGQTICRPICGCVNGNCRAPGECECYEGFVKNDNGDCVFACPLGCQNGRCYLDGSCQCDPGYKLDETRKFCRPICSAGCTNNVRHNCSEPEVCSCAKGYQLTDKDEDGCQPICEPDCGFGGTCNQNRECICDAASGYRLKDGVCQSDCYQRCHNGVCVSRNRCICDAGFSYHEHSTMCVPN